MTPWQCLTCRLINWGGEEPPDRCAIHRGTEGFALLSDREVARAKSAGCLAVYQQETHAHRRTAQGDRGRAAAGPARAALRGRAG